MSYLTIKYIKGNPYLYQVRSERRGDRVVQVFERYLGRAETADREIVEVSPVARKRIAEMPVAIPTTEEVVAPEIREATPEPMVTPTPEVMPTANELAAIGKYPELDTAITKRNNLIDRYAQAEARAMGRPRKVVEKLFQEREDAEGEVARLHREILKRDYGLEPRAIPKAEVTPPVTLEVVGQRFTPDTAHDIDELTNIVLDGRAPVENYAQIEETLREWTMREPGDVRKLTRLTRMNPEYLNRLHSILKKQYGENVVVYRGGVVGKGTISVTTDKDIATRFGAVSQFSIKTDKILAASPTIESELIVQVRDLKPAVVEAPYLAEGITIQLETPIADEG